MQLTLIQMAGLILTLVAVTIVGVSAVRKVKNAEDFTVGGRASGSTLVAGTIVGTIIGGAATVGTAQLAFTVGLSAWWFSLGAGIALFLMAAFYAKPLRASGLQTIPQFLAAHFGPIAAPLTCLSASFGMFFSLVANVLSAVPLVTAMLGFTPLLSTGMVFLLILAYVLFGGVWATGRVGVLKTVLIYFMLIAVFVATYDHMGGITGFTAAFEPFPWFSLFGRGVGTDLAAGLSLVVGTLTTQTYVQAVFGASDVKAARRGAMIAALLTLPTGIPAVMVGLYMRVHHPDIAPIDALPLFILKYLPEWLGGMSIGALLLASVGSAAGVALGIGTMLTRDLMQGWFGNFSEKFLLAANRLSVLLITLGASLFTFGNMKSLVLDWNFLSMGLRGAGAFLPLTLAIFFPGWLKKTPAIASMLGGTFTALLWKFFFPAEIDPLYAGLMASGALLVSFQLFEIKRR